MATATTRTTWRRLKRNKGALFGIVIIVLALFVALLAHILASDGTPNANRMIVEIGGQKPGYGGASELQGELPSAVDGIVINAVLVNLCT